MLAWLHQATASEREHLEALLKLVTRQGAANIVPIVHTFPLGKFAFVQVFIIAWLGALFTGSGNNKESYVTPFLFFKNF